MTWICSKCKQPIHMGSSLPEHSFKRSKCGLFSHDECPTSRICLECGDELTHEERDTDICNNCYFEELNNNE